MVHGGKDTVDAILEHPLIPAISFVGSSPVAKYIYQTGYATWEKGSGTGRRKESCCCYA